MAGVLPYRGIGKKLGSKPADAVRSSRLMVVETAAES
jgi:hypothetical protein